MKESFVAIFILLLITAAGLYIRLDAVAEPIWLDECHTAWTVDADTAVEVADRAADGNQPPLYFWLVWLATQGFGLSELSLRIVSIVSGMGLLVTATWFAKVLTDRWSAAVLVAGLIAFDGQFIYYASEARSYALVQLLGLVQAVAFWCTLKVNGRALNSEWQGASRRFVAIEPAASALPLIFTRLALPVWTILSALLLYCHYTSVWIIAAEVLMMICVSIKQKAFPTGFTVASVLVAASLIPRFWNVSMVFARRSNWGPVSSRARLWTDVEPWLVYWLLIPVGFLLAAWLVRMASQSSERRKENQLPNWLLNTWLLVWAISGPLGIAMVDWMQIAPMALLRYSAVCWVAMALFAANCLRLYSPRMSWVVAIAILLSSFFGNWWASELVSDQKLPTFRGEDWVTTVSQISDSDSDQPVFQLADVIEDIDSLTITDKRFNDYLQFPLRGANAVSEQDLISNGRQLFVIPTWSVEFTQQHLEAIREADGCWLVVRGDLDYAVIVPGILEKYLKESIEFRLLPNEQMPFDKVHLIRVRTLGD